MEKGSCFCLDSVNSSSNILRMASYNEYHGPFESSLSSVTIFFDPCDNRKGKCSHSCFAEKINKQTKKNRDSERL